MNALRLLLLLCLAPATAFAHAGAPPGTLGLVPHAESASALSLEATFGLLVSDDTTEWRWLCHETIARPGAFLTPRYERSSDGVYLATLEVLQQGQDPQESIYRATDLCDWAPPAGLRDQVVTDIAFDPANPDVALALTGGVTVGSLNGIHRSTDAGETFAPTSVADEDQRIFRSVEVSSAASDDGTTAWATAAWFGPLGAWVYRSTDGGATWEEHPQTLMDGDDLQILLDIAEVHPTDPLVAWISIDGQLGDRVLRTDDGGASFTEIFRADSDVQDVLYEADGTVWVATVESGLHRATDGENFTEVKGAPMVNAMWADARGVHLAAAGGIGEDVIITTQDGASFTPTMVWDDLVEPIDCPDGSDGQVFCDPNWIVVESTLGRNLQDDDDASDDDDDDDSSEPEPTGCCPQESSIAASDAGAGGVMFGAALALGLRRRGRSRQL